MSKKTLNLLILEDNPDDAELIVKELEREGFILNWKRVETEKAFKEALKEKPGLILADYKLPSFSGPEALKIQQKLNPDIPLIIVTGTVGEEQIIECMKAGATDYVLKDKLSRLNLVVKRALKEAEEHRERKKAEEALGKSEEKFRLITENTSDVVTLQTFDLKASYIYVSPSMKAMSGYEPEEMLGRSVFEFIHPDDKKNLLPLLKKYVTLKIKNLLTGKNFFLNETIEFRCKDKSGNWRYAQSTGNIVGNQLLFVTRDITERKQAEKALRESESQKRAILDGITTNIAFVNKNLEILWVNKASAISVGKSPGEMIGHKCYELWADPQRPCEGCPTVKAWKTRKSEHAIMNTPDGRVWEERGEPIFDQYGKLIGMVEIARDITERKRAEEELDKYREHLEELVKDRTQKLEEQNKELGRLNNLFVNREFRIKELRDKVKELEEKISDI